MGGYGAETVAGVYAGHGGLMRAVRGRKVATREQWCGALAEQSARLGAHA
jgi:hypothetical protein